MSQIISNFKYRPEIDGLRAIAVLAVVLFHAGLGVSGGFVGVDVFFVISGFLITSLIIKDLEAEKFTFFDFWERRARRILPAGLFLVLVVLFAGWFILLPFDFIALGKSVLSQSVFSSNIYFWRATDYFGSLAQEQPLLHTWSLAVEEQFYLFFPLLLAVLFRFQKFRKRGFLLIVFIAIFLMSLCLSAYSVTRMADATFFLLPTRIWELVLGSIVALTPNLIVHRSQRLRELICVAGLLAILIPCFVYTKATVFPGPAALFPCFGAALFIWGSVSGSKSVENSELLFKKLMSGRVLVFFGLISYSLYLWHWPFFAFSDYMTLEQTSWGLRLILVCVSILMAVLSWYFLETPFRRRRLGHTRSKMFGWSIAGIGISVVLATALLYQSGFPSRFSGKAVAFDNAKKDARDGFTKKITLSDAVAGNFPSIGYNTLDSPVLMVWGDSHARSILPALDYLAKERSLAVQTAWYSATPPVLNFASRFPTSLRGSSPVFNQKVLDYVSSSSIPAVLMVARWEAYFSPEMDLVSSIANDPFARSLLSTVHEIRAIGSIPYIFLEVPNHHIRVPKALIVNEVHGTDILPFAAKLSDLETQSLKMSKLVPELIRAGAIILDASSILYDAAQEHFRMEIGGVPLYYDNHHLTRKGAIAIRDALSPVFESVSAERVLLQ